MKIHKSRILYEDEHLLAVNKLSNELTVKGSGKVQKLPLFDLLKPYFPGLRVIHRLDFETSGVLLFAKTKEAYEGLRKIEDWLKVYRTVAKGRFKQRSGTISTPLKARGSSKTVPAESKYKVLNQYLNSAELEVTIKTGRHHQIRRHLADISHPLALDKVYGDKKFNSTFTKEFGYRYFFLHASRLEFRHPITKKGVIIKAPLPKVFEQALEQLKPYKL